MTSQPYIGFDGIAAGEHPQLTALIKGLLGAYPALWSNGSFGVRKMRNKTSMSVHSTGRAWDASWRFLSASNKGLPKGGRKQALAAMEWLRTHHNRCGIQLIIDYYPAPYGRAASCVRDMAWKKYAAHTVSGAPMGDWFHLEVDGRKSPAEITKVFNDFPPTQ